MWEMLFLYFIDFCCTAEGFDLFLSTLSVLVLLLINICIQISYKGTLKVKIKKRNKKQFLPLIKNLTIPQKLPKTITSELLIL